MIGASQWVSQWGLWLQSPHWPASCVSCLHGAIGLYLHWSFLNKQTPLLWVRAAVTQVEPDVAGSPKSWTQCKILLRGMMNRLRWGCTTQMEGSDQMVSGQDLLKSHRRVKEIQAPRMATAWSNSSEHSSKMERARSGPACHRGYLPLSIASWSNVLRRILRLWLGHVGKSAMTN